MNRSCENACGAETNLCWLLLLLMFDLFFLNQVPYR